MQKLNNVIAFSPKPINFNSKNILPNIFHQFEATIQSHYRNVTSFSLEFFFKIKKN